MRTSYAQDQEIVSQQYNQRAHAEAQPAPNQQARHDSDYNQSCAQHEMKLAPAVRGLLSHSH
ncbi:hypothetical protein [Hymenobacter roseosalivarius]|uniref:hypothetical protein n=1 Tax=Hymenobacter roseosalivarius TaxID=89967 RepID=UPI0013562E44|nr:hypothetical protein [Hymenobacter roseosalivarius]